MNVVQMNLENMNDKLEKVKQQLSIKDYEELQEITTESVESSETAVNVLNEILEVDMNSAWVNDQYENEYQGVHTHSGKEDLGFSSIMYLKVPDFGKEITDTGDPLNGKTELIGNCGGIWNCPTHLITPKVGDFYIFPYDMQHLVYPFTGNGMRRSLVINVDITRTKKFKMKEGKRDGYGK